MDTLAMNTDTIATIDNAFNPRSIAVIGVSPEPWSIGQHYVRHLLDYGYKGLIYPVHPSGQSVYGLTTYPRLSAIPEPVDYIVCCLPASKVIDLLAEGSEKGVKIAHLFTGRLSETGRKEADELEGQILQQAKRLGIRLLGPNCQGLYYPRGGIAFNYDLPHEPGIVGAIFQSAGLANVFIQSSSLRGLRFSKVISYGNGLDMDESDFLDYLAQDNETEIITAYFEGVKDGERFLHALRGAAAVKPVIVIKAGSSKSGARAAASHTAAIAGSIDVWRVALKQAGVVLAHNFNELIDLAVSFSFLPPITGKRVGVVGGGGGKGVLAADECEEAGLDVIPLPAEIREQLKEKDPLLWDWLGNPMDRSIMAGSPLDTGDILRMMSGTSHFDCIITNLTEDNPLDEANWSALVAKETDDFIEIAKQGLKPMATVVSTQALTSSNLQDWRWKCLAEQRERLIQARLPVYSTVAQAAWAINKLADYYQRKDGHRATLP